MLKTCKIAGEDVRSVILQGKQYFSVQDVGKMLKLSDPSTVARQNERRYVDIGGGRQLRVISKEEVIKLIFSATHRTSPTVMREAKAQARRWVLEQVHFPEEGDES